MAVYCQISNNLSPRELTEYIGEKRWTKGGKREVHFHVLGRVLKCRFAKDDRASVFGAERLGFSCQF